MKSVSLEKLSFNSGKFVLTEVSTPKLRAKISANSYWKDIGDDSYETDNLGAAAAFRKCSDLRTSKIFNRLFQEHYLPPKCESLYPGLLDRLDPHQREGLLWILTRKRSYLAHAPGAGKTVQAIMAACLAEGNGQSIFIVPPALTLNWEREILKFTEWVGLWPAIGVVGRSEKQDRVAWSADFLIVPDSMLTKPWVRQMLVPRASHAKLVAVDEASRLKEPFAERSLAFYGGASEESVQPYTDLFRKARHVVFLDGSPMPNRPIELWAPTYALHPESIDCMSYDDFGYRYCGAKPNDRGQWEYKFSSNEDELKAKLQRDFMHVVTEDKLTHPERLRSMLFMDEDVRSVEQKKWERGNLTNEFVAKLTDDTQGDVARFRRELGIRKIPWVANYVSQRIKDKAESILVFAWHRDVVRELGERLGAPVILGGTTASDRDMRMKGFQSGKYRILVLNILAAGRGFNLQKASRAVFAEFSWTDELNKQCEHRGARRGNALEYFRSDYIVCPNSMDEPVLSSVFSKEKRVKRIIG